MSGIQVSVSPDDSIVRQKSSSDVLARAGKITSGITLMKLKSWRLIMEPFYVKRSLIFFNGYRSLLKEILKL